MTADKPSVRARGQISAARLPSPYSIRNAALPAFTKGPADGQSVSMQLNTTAQSKSATSS